MIGEPETTPGNPETVALHTTLAEDPGIEARRLQPNDARQSDPPSLGLLPAPAHPADSLGLQLAPEPVAAPSATAGSAGAFQEAFVQADLRLTSRGIRLAQLKEKHGLEPQLSAHITSLEALAGCLVRNDGVVPKDGPTLAFALVSIDLIAAPNAEKKVLPQIGEARKEFAPGAEIALEKVEYMNVLATVALFMNATMRQLQEKLGAG